MRDKGKIMTCLSFTRLYYIYYTYLEPSTHILCLLRSLFQQTATSGIIKAIYEAMDPSRSFQLDGIAAIKSVKIQV